MIEIRYQGSSHTSNLADLILTSTDGIRLVDVGTEELIAIMQSWKGIKVLVQIEVKITRALPSPLLWSH